MKKFFFVFFCFVSWASFAVGANQFVWSGAATPGDCATVGECWGNAFTTLHRNYSTIAGFNEVTEFVYVRSIHSETISTNVSIIGLDAAGTNAFTRVLSVAGADTGTVPGALTVGATVNRSGFADQDWDGKIFVYGLTSRSDEMNFCSSAGISSHLVFDNCTLDQDDGGSTGLWGESLHACLIQLIDTNIEANLTAVIQLVGGTLEWYGGTWQNDVNTVFRVNPSGTNDPMLLYLDGVDFSAVDGILVSDFANSSTPFLFVANRLRIHASVTLVDSTFDYPGFDAILLTHKMV